MDNVKLIEKCRACLKSAGSISLFHKENKMAFSDMFFVCTSVSVLPEERGPHDLCEKCLNRLKDAFLFRTQCQESEAKLRELHEIKLEDCVEKIEIKVIDVSDHDFCNDDDDRFSENSLPLQTIKNEELRKAALQKMVSNLDDSKKAKSIKKEKRLNKNSIKNKAWQKTKEKSCHDNDSVFKKVRKKIKPNEVLEYFCDVCTFSTKNKYTLINHIRHHTGEKPFKCETCGKSYSSSMSLYNHVKSCQKASVCDVCGKLYKAMEYHRLMHSTEKAHHCNICVAAFNTKQQLNQHIKWHNKDSRVRNHQCSVCSKLFYNVTSLNDHMVIHSSDRELYPCGICQKTYYNKSALSTHMKRHTLVKNFICDECSKAFFSKAELMSHIVSHLGKKSFECEECGKSFLRKCSLTSHKITHTKTKNYACDVCHQRFARNSSLYDHRRKKHNVTSARGTGQRLISIPENPAVT